MSSFISSPKVINTVANAVCKYASKLPKRYCGEDGTPSFEKVANALYSLNVRAYNYNYGEHVPTDGFTCSAPEHVSLLQEYKWMQSWMCQCDVAERFVNSPIYRVVVGLTASEMYIKYGEERGKHIGVLNPCDDPEYAECAWS